MKLIFVYNAKSGLFNAVFGAGHKLLDPNTYPCRLCALTYDAFSENSKWKKYRKELTIKMEFLHNDEFEKKYPNRKFRYPTILKAEQNALKPFMSLNELNRIENLDALIFEIDKRLVATL